MSGFKKSKKWPRINETVSLAIEQGCAISLLPRGVTCVSDVVRAIGRTKGNDVGSIEAAESSSAVELSAVKITHC